MEKEKKFRHKKKDETKSDYDEESRFCFISNPIGCNPVISETKIKRLSLPNVK